MRVLFKQPRYYGIFASHHRLRNRIIPKPQALPPIGGFGAQFAAGWAMSKVYKRKSGPL